MKALLTTPHGALRMAQRGISASDVELMQLIGTEVEGGYLVREKDVELVDHELKRFCNRIRKLVGKRLVLNSSTVVTAYHANQRTLRLRQLHFPGRSGAFLECQKNTGL
jgi:hypothetical protein